MASLACLIAAAPRESDRRGWSAFGGGANNIHYSSLTQINRSNAEKLRVAWQYDTRDELRRKGSEMECNPIVVGGVLFATTPKLRVIALDAATGKLKWSFDPNKGEQPPGKMRNRGVAYWSGGNEGDARIFVASREFMYAPVAATGKPVAGFGKGPGSTCGKTWGATLVR